MRRIGITLLVAVAVATPATARSHRPRPAIRATLPEKTLPGQGDFLFGLASGPSWSQDFAVAGRLAAMAGMGQEAGPHGEVGFQVAPLVEASGSQALTDLMTSPTTDLAILPLLVMESVARERPLTKSRLGYVAPLYLETVHLVAGAGIKDAADLAGRKVALESRDGVGAALFKALGIAVSPVDMPVSSGIDALGKGDVDAVVVVSADPVPALSTIPPASGFHLVPVGYPRSLEAGFVPTHVTASDAPGLQGPGGTDTVAVQAVLAAYMHPPRGERALTLGSLVAGIMDHLDTAGKDVPGRKLRDVNWAATLPGWTRLPAAQRWLDERARLTPKPEEETK